MPQVIYLPRWAKIKQDNHPGSKRVMDAVFTLGVSLRYDDYLTEEDLKSYRLALINEDNISPLYAAPDLTVARPPAAKVASSGSSTEAMQPTVVPSSSTFVPPWVSTEVVAVSRGASLCWSVATGLRKAPCVGSMMPPSVL